MQDEERQISCPAAIRKTEYHSDLQQLPVCRSDRRPGGCFFVLLNVRRKLYGNTDGRRPDVRRAVNSDSIEHLTVFVYGAGSFFLIRYLHWCVSVFIHIYGYIVTGSFAAV